MRLLVVWRLAALELLGVVAPLQDRAKSAGTRISRAGAVGMDGDLMFGQAADLLSIDSVIAHAGHRLVEPQLA